MKNTGFRERPFEYMRRRADGEHYPEEVVQNWYIARAFVLDKLKDVAFPPDFSGHLHAIVDGDSPLMLAVTRQLALSAHYLNYSQRTVISLVTAKEADVIMGELKKEENLGNLPDYCKYSVSGTVKNEESFVDIELNIVRSRPVDECGILITEEEVRAFAASSDPALLFSIDTRKAVFAGRTYKLGAAVDNLQYEGPYSPGRYNQALYTFQYKVLQDKQLLPLIGQDWEMNRAAVMSGVSNIHCSDCFESRELAVRRQCSGYDKLGEKKRMALWEKNNDALSQSEHNRWLTEKLILGYRPLNAREMTEFESLFGQEKSAYLSRLKNDPSSPAHIDLCSFRDLRRIDPGNMKYDSFLVLAIPLILRAIR